MTDQSSFMEVVNSVAEIVKTSEVPMKEEEILQYFADMDLDSNQKKMILEYIFAPSEDESEQELANPDEEDDFSEEGRSKVFKFYLEELETMPDVTADQRTQYYERLASGDTDAVKAILNAWLKKVLFIAQKYSDSRLHMDDLVQEGNMSLLIKLQELLGQPQIEEVEKVLSAAVEEGIMTYCSQAIGTDELQNTLIGKMSLVYEAKKMLSVETGEEPTLDELADYTRIPREELLEIQEYMNQK